MLKATAAKAMRINKRAKDFRPLAATLWAIKNEKFKAFLNLTANKQHNSTRWVFLSHEFTNFTN